MQNNISNVTFSSKINFVSPPKLQRYLPKTAVKVEAGDLSTAKNLGKDGKGYTDEIIYCIAGLLKRGGDNWLFHFYPKEILANFEPLKKAVEAIPSNEKLKGLLIGGLNVNENGASKKFKTAKHKSCELMRKIDSVFKRFTDKDFSIFFGQKRTSKCPISDLFYEVDKDTYHISMSEVNVDDLWDDGKSNDEIPTVEKIKAAFRFIQISPNDEVFIDGKHIDRELLNTRAPAKASPTKQR